MRPLLYPVNFVQEELEIKKSKFISLLYPFKTEDGIKKKLQELRSVHKKANHVVYAFAVGNGRTYNKGMSDDGEPSGTAGKPVLSVIEGRNYTNILIAVVRYFGGIKLGTGGLVKAYSEAASLVIKSGNFNELLDFIKVSLVFSYNHQGAVMGVLNFFNLDVAESEYLQKVYLYIFVEEKKILDLEKKLVNATNGDIKIFLDKDT